MVTQHDDATRGRNPRVACVHLGHRLECSAAQCSHWSIIQFEYGFARNDACMWYDAILPQTMQSNTEFVGSIKGTSDSRAHDEILISLLEGTKVTLSFAVGARWRAVKYSKQYFKNSILSSCVLTSMVFHFS